MNTDLILSAASGADSTQAQEQSVKSFSSSSSNLNNVEVDEVEEFDLDDYKYDYHTGNPAVYVGTYHKYNCGSIFGMWFDLTTFADYDEFCAVCRFLHRDESDPELMAQDYENFPEEWYTEGGVIDGADEVAGTEVIGEAVNHDFRWTADEIVGHVLEVVGGFDG